MAAFRADFGLSGEQDTLSGGSGNDTLYGGGNDNIVT